MLGCNLSQRSRFGLCVLRLSRITCISRPGLSAMSSFMKSRNSRRRRRLLVSGLYLSSRDIQCGEQRCRPMALVAMTEAIDRLAVGQAQIALGTLQRLNVRLFIHAKHYRIVGRTEIHTHHISCFWPELRVGRDAPAPASLQLNGVKNGGSFALL